MITREDILTRFHKFFPDDSPESQRDTLASMVIDMADHIAKLENEAVVVGRNLREANHRNESLEKQLRLERRASDMVQLTLHAKILDIAQSLVDAVK